MIGSVQCFWFLGLLPCPVTVESVSVLSNVLLTTVVNCAYVPVVYDLPLISRVHSVRIANT